MLHTAQCDFGWVAVTSNFKTICALHVYLYDAVIQTCQQFAKFDSLDKQGIEEQDFTTLLDSSKLDIIE